MNSAKVALNDAKVALNGAKVAFNNRGMTATAVGHNAKDRIELRALVRKYIHFHSATLIQLVYFRFGLFSSYTRP